MIVSAMAAASISPPDPVRPVGPMLPLPDRHVVFDAVDEQTTGAEGLRPVRRGGDADDGGFTDFEGAEAMGRCHAHARDLLFDACSDARELLLRHRRVTVVLEQRHRATVLMIAHHAEEKIDASELRRCYEGEHSGDVEGLGLNNETAHGSSARTKKSLCPPDLEMRRVGPRVIARSMPLSMS